MASQTRRSGQIIQRDERVFLVRIFLGRDETGKRRYSNKTIRGDKKAAQKYLNQALRDRDLGTFVEPSKVSLNAHLDRWLNATAATRVKPRTLESYRQTLELYVRPDLGVLPLSAIGLSEIEDLYAGLQERGLSSRTVRYTHSVLHSAMQQAVRWRLVAFNPTDGATLPHMTREEMRPLTPAEARTFLEAAAGTRFGVLFELLLSTGLRPGEALALRWSDVDLAAGRLIVQRALILDRGKREEGEDRPRLKFDEPKTPNARRTVPMPASTVKALRGHRRSQRLEKQFAGVAYRDQDLVFATRNGKPMAHRNLVRDYFKPLLEAAGLPATIRLYDLRHTCATLLLAAGENPKVVSERLGHASVTLTLDTYSHVLPDMQESAAAKLEALLYAGKGQA